VESSCECDNEPSVFIKLWETIEWPNNWWREIASTRREFMLGFGGRAKRKETAKEVVG
jgi:hypothetical protein